MSPSDDQVTRVVRRLGSARVHVAEVPRSAMIIAHFITDFEGLEPPVVTRCGAKLRGPGRRSIVCMEVGTKVDCRPCRFATGITEVTDVHAPQMVRRHAPQMVAEG